MTSPTGMIWIVHRSLVLIVDDPGSVVFSCQAWAQDSGWFWMVALKVLVLSGLGDGACGVWGGMELQ